MVLKIFEAELLNVPSVLGYSVAANTKFVTGIRVRHDYRFRLKWTQSETCSDEQYSLNQTPIPGLWSNGL